MRAVLMVGCLKEWKQQETNPQECTVKSAGDPVQCRFDTKEGSGII